MSHREVSQLSLADGLVSRRSRGSGALDVLADSVDWGRFQRLMRDVYGSRRGRPSYPPLVLFKSLLLQQWYGLSDPGLEEALEDRLSFRRFVGLSLDAPVPDHSTLSRFRQQLSQRNLGDKLFGELNRQFDQQGLILREGTLIDASLVEADARRPRKGEDKSTTKRSDDDATWTVKRNTPHFGYKAHVAVDQGSGLIRKAILTPANVSDRTPAADLIQGDEGILYADKGYDGWWFRDRLEEAGVRDGVMHCNYAKRPLTEGQKQRNREISNVRSSVERCFAVMKRWYGYRRVRYRSLTRNDLQLQLMCMAINLRRSVVLTS